MRTPAGWTGCASRGVPAITGLDTRALVRHIRDLGVDARRHLRRRDSPGRRDRADPGGDVDDRPRSRPAGQPVRGHRRSSRPAARTPIRGRTPTIAVLDTGVKRSILDNLRSRGARLMMFPCTTDAAEILDADPDAVFLANGPGDPAALDYIVDQVRLMLGRKPVFGICLGHQVLCRAVGLETYKLRVRPPGGQPSGQGPRDRTDRDHQPEPRVRRARARRGPDDPRRRAGRLGDGLRPGRADPPQPVRPDRRGPGAARRRGVDRPVPPGGRPGPHDALHLFDRFVARDLMPRRDDIQRIMILGSGRS